MELKPNEMDARNRKKLTKLTNEEFESCWKIAKAFLLKNKAIKNQQLREITGIGYDQAIGFFNRAVTEKRILRRGAGSGTHYELND